MHGRILEIDDTANIVFLVSAVAEPEDLPVVSVRCRFLSEELPGIVTRFRGSIDDLFCALCDSEEDVFDA